MTGSGHLSREPEERLAINPRQWPLEERERESATGLFLSPGLPPSLRESDRFISSLERGREGGREREGGGRAGRGSERRRETGRGREGGREREGYKFSLSPRRRGCHG